jgi:hypothetical protein
MNDHIRGCYWRESPHTSVTTAHCTCDILRRAWRERDRLELQVIEVIRERDLARNIAVTLEQEIAACPVLNHRGLRG